MQRMKDSGVPWVGEMPDDWKVLRIKQLASGQDSLFMDGDWIESDIIVSEGIRYLTTGNIGSLYYREQGAGYISEDTFKKLECLCVYPNDLAISRLNEPLGRACLIPDDFDKYVVAVDIVILRPGRNFNKKFLVYCMNIDSYNFHVKLYARGTTMPRISRTILGNMEIPIPPFETQKNISCHLDAKCAEIEAIATDIRATIEKFNEYKQTVITRAVTKGLDPTAPMKDSGVPWIGEISVNWELRKLKSITHIISKGTTPSTVGQEIVSSGEIRFIKAENIYKGTVNLTPEFYITKETDDMLARSRLFDNDILFVIAGATIGKTAIIKNDCLPANTNQAVAFIRLKENENHKYIQYYLQSSCVTEIINITSVQSAQPNLSLSNLGNFYIPYPPITYQKTISDYLDAKCAEIDEAIAEQETLLAKLEEYKKSLIYECVTGKREVSAP